MFLDFSIIINNMDKFIHGVYLTLLLTIVPLFFGFFLAVISAVSMVEKTPILGKLAKAYSLLFRGSPMLVQTYLVYYGLAQFEWVRESFLWFFLKDAYFCVILVFSLNTGAYAAEFMRSGILATPFGEIEAAKTFGFSKWQIYRYIILPSTFRRIIPQYSNEVIYLMQGSSIASVFTLLDITGAARWVNASFNVAYEGMLTGAVLYIILTYSILYTFRFFEKKFLRHLYIR